ncbi:aminotransferase class I/II-fold pyridoxal phosphate-dependent enzyme [Polyangium sorediatum]|uniref:8-amino-7-oxononanoate synthase n=1 Tax=Polyangium sorediatum TaxID=889274 RepID=A0ABT6P6C5_9BACT|nr:8-amino-7-oxononanoate synthase [Polyangium sorediatum]MDI1436098.1 8-amino-7-oxononanoate synthase [Polyangium sorediatum]
MTDLGALRHLAAEITALEQAGLLRKPSAPPPAGCLVLCSNDYLGYGTDPWPAPVEAPSGAGASRLVSGHHAEHALAEQTIATWLGFEAALLFSSGYAANVGTLSALARPGDVIVSDALNHASIIDGCRLSGAKVVVVPHRDVAAAEAALEQAQGAPRRWLVTESYFSMDGDSPDLVRLRAACDRWDAALIVDEAHAVGSLGPEGRGLAARAGVRPDVLVGALGKALGLQGAFVAGPMVLRTWLWNRARSFVFSTGISPALAAAIRHRVLRVAADDEARARLDRVTSRLRADLTSVVGDALLPSHGPILPCFVGPPEEAIRISLRLRERGILVQAIRPPTVPPGTSRLRVTAHARLTDADLSRVVAAFAESWKP